MATTLTPVKSMSLDEVHAEMGEIRPKLKAVFDEAGENLDMSKVTVLGEGDERFKSTQLANLNLRYDELATRRAELVAADERKRRLEQDEKDAQTPKGKAPLPKGGAADPERHYKAFADLAMGHKDKWLVSGQKNGPIAEIDLDAKDWLEHEVKTVMSTGAGFAPQAIRTGLVVPAAYQQPTVIDLIPIVRTNQSAYVFMAQTTRTNNAAEVAESADGSLQSLAESAFAYTETSETIRKIGHFVPVTDEQLEDIEGIEDLLRNDMIVGVRQRLSSQILNGDGTAPNVEGFYDAGRTGVNQHDATGQNLAVAIDNAIEDVEVTGFASPDGCVVHPTDWHKWRRIQTADGIFINGSPSEVGPRTLWGLPVVTTTETASGKALVGAFRDFSRLAVKRGVEVSISSEHASYFIQGVKAIKAEMRATLAVLREAAFTEVSNIA